MLKQLQDWFSNTTPTREGVPIDLATAALLVEVMAADDEWTEAEAQSIQEQLAQLLNLAPHEAGILFEDARAHQKNAHDLYELTRAINDHFSPDQKFDLIVRLWRVAYADGNLDRFEDHIIRKIAELIYVPHSDFIKAKLSVSPP